MATEKRVAAISVTRLARRIRNLLEIQIGKVWVEGEVSNLRKQGSGHWYFSLKDEDAQISCAMFGARRRPGAEVMQDGAQVQVLAEVSFYQARGSTQLIVTKVQAVGLGGLQARFESLKLKLSGEGLFASERKKKLPTFPRRVAVVTSPTGAALQDMLNVLNRRAPWLEVFLYPSAVQGKGAERGIAAQIKAAGQEGPDVVIVARGGGSLEDLWNFNEEVVARAIAACPVPVVSGVGHEIDFTIADFAADLRAPTPSAAAELVAPDGEDLRARVKQLRQLLRQRVRRHLERKEERLDRTRMGPLGRSPELLLREPEYRVEQARTRLLREISESLREKEAVLSSLREQWQRFHPEAQMERRVGRLTQVWSRFRQVVEQGLLRRESQLQLMEGQLRLLSPEATLKRGYTMTTDAKGVPIRTPEQVKARQVITTHLAEGAIRSTVRAEPQKD